MIDALGGEKERRMRKLLSLSTHILILLEIDEGSGEWETPGVYENVVYDELRAIIIPVCVSFFVLTKVFFRTI